MGRKVNPKRLAASPGTNYCSSCDEYKPFDAFYARKTGHNGRAWECRQCNKNREQRTCRINWDRKKNYGISADEYQFLLKKQQGLCAICGNPEKKVFNGKLCNLAVDHNHETGKIRGLLCNACNVGLGSFRDDAETLKNAIDYLNATV